MRARESKVPVGPFVAAVGAVLLIVSLFLNWYEGDLEGFTVFEFLDLVLVLMALLTIASLAGGLGLVRPAPSPGISLAVAVFTILVVLSQVINDPPAVVGADRGHEVGIWLALGGAALMVLGSVLAYARISLAFERRTGPGLGGPPAAAEGRAADDRERPLFGDRPDTADDVQDTRAFDDPDEPGAVDGPERARP